MSEIQNELELLLQQCCAELEDPSQTFEILEAKHRELLDQFFVCHNISNTAQQQAMIQQAIEE